MNADNLALHFVCTWDEAEDLIAAASDFWVCSCG